MSRAQKPSSDPSSLSVSGDKPDKKLFLGSPISPLRQVATASSSSSSSGRLPAGAAPVRSHSGELSGSSDGSPNSHMRPRHRLSGSGPLVFSGGASSPAATVLPAGNICSSGEIGCSVPRTTRTDVLGSGTGHYGHGSIMRGGAPKPADPEEVTRAGNEQYKRGHLVEVLKLYEKAVAMCPGNAACRNNRAAALAVLGMLGEAVRECEEAVRLDPTYGRAHQRFGQVDNARKHFNMAGQYRDHAEFQKLQAVQRHLRRCEDFRKIWDWKGALREADAAIAAGVDSSPLLMALRAETLLQLHHLEEADSTLSNALKLEITSSSSSQSQSFGMLSDSYIYLVQAQVDMALGRSENAVVAAEKAWQIDPRNGEVNMTLNNVKSVAKARNRGNELFKLGIYSDACIAYGEGLKYDPSNPVLHCNRAA